MDGGKRRTKRRWWRRVAVLAILAIVIVGFGPRLISIPLVRSTVIARMTDGLPITLSVDSVSLGWTRPIVIRGLTVVDERQQPVLTAEIVSTQKSLWSLINNQRDWGSILVRQPVVSMEFTQRGSNLESLIEEFTNRSSDEGSATTGAIAIEGGRIHFTDPVANGEFWAEKISGKAEWGGVETAELTLDGRLGTDAQKGRVHLHIAWLDSDGIEIAGQVERIPLRVADALIRRSVEAWQASGTISIDARYRWAAASPHQFQIQSLTGDQVAVQWNAEGGALHTERLIASGRCQFSDRAGRFDQFSVTSDLGHATLTGVIPWPEQTTDSTINSTVGAWIARLTAREPMSLSGEVDLAAVASTFPSMIPVRDGLEITDGRFVVGMEGRPVDDRYEWTGSIQATDVVGNSHGSDLRWDHPVKIKAGLSLGPAGFDVTTFVCESDFMEAQLTGNTRAATLTTQIELSAFMRQAEQFLDLGGQAMHFSGTLAARANWICTDEGAYTLTGAVATHQFQLERPGSATWAEPQLNLSFDAAGSNDPGRFSIDRGSLNLASGSDTLDVRLREPVETISAETEWPIHLALSGRAETWIARSTALFGPVADLSGQFRLDATLTTGPAATEIHSAKLTAEEVRYFSPDRAIDEPVVEVELSGRFEPSRRRWTSDETVVRTSTFALRAVGVDVSLEPGAYAFAGSVAYRGHLNRLSTWVLSPQQLQSERWSGEVTGLLTANHRSGITSMTGNAELANVQFARPVTTDPRRGFAPAGHAAAWDTVWSGQHLGLAASADYDGSTSTLTLHEFGASSRLSRLWGKGSLETAGEGRVGIAGQWEYDFAQLNRWVKLFLGDQVEFTGSGSETFRLDGPVWPVLSRTGPWPSDLTATGAIGWDAARIYGFSIGSGRLAVELAQGSLRMEPQILEVSGGRLHVHPTVQLNQDPIAVTQAAGPLIERVNLTADMCRQWLKFAAPMIADATQVQGQCSFTLDQARIPVGRPGEAQVAGILDIHSARAGPGPLGRELALLAHAIPSILAGRNPGGAARADSTLVEMPEQRIQIVLANGRVTHSEVVWVIDRTVVRTRGSVGLDQSLSLMASVAIQPEWIGDERLRAALANQTVDVPISGTLDRPRLDRRALDQLAAKMVSGAAQRLIEQQIGRGLHRLFDR